MTLDEALVILVPRTGFSDRDLLDLIDLANDPNGFALVVATYVDKDAGPDRTLWQTIAGVLGTVEDVAQRVMPLVAIAQQLAAL